MCHVTDSRRRFLTTVGAAYIASCVKSEGILSSPTALGTDPSTKPTVLLYSGWNTRNIGDQGHTPGTVRFLQKHWSDADLTVWLATTNDEITAMLQRRFPSTRFVYGRIDAAGKTSNSNLESAFSQADLLIHNSGMSYNSFWESPSILEACLNRKKPICLYGQSFDGFTEENRQSMVEQLSRSAAIYCRDVESFEYLRSIGVNPPILEFGPDGCFGIDLRDDARAMAYLGKHRLMPKQFITVTIRTNTPAGAKPKMVPKWDIGDRSQNPWDPNETDRQQTQRWAEVLRKVITHYVRSTKRKVLLAPEVAKEIPHAKRLLLDLLPNDVKPYVVHKSVWWNMDEACSTYAQAEAVVSMEPHSCIMALANGTPTLHLYSQRHGLKAWMFRDIGLPEWLHDIDFSPASQIVSSLDQIHSNHDRARRKVARAMSFVEQRSEEIVKDLRVCFARQS